MKPEVQCHIHYDSPLIPILRWINTISVSTLITLISILTLSSHLRLGLRRDLLPIGLPIKILKTLHQERRGQVISRLFSQMPGLYPPSLSQESLLITIGKFEEGLIMRKLQDSHLEFTPQITFWIWIRNGPIIFKRKFPEREYNLYMFLGNIPNPWPWVDSCSTQNEKNI
jgi:hypothetical protein